MESIKILSALSLIVLVIGSVPFMSTSCEPLDEASDQAISADQASSDNWLDHDWLYRKRIEISDPVDDYQMKLNVSYDGGGNVSCEGNVNEDFSDLRFTGADGVSTRPYWIEERVNGSYAVTWIKTSGEDSMYMYYGNPEAVSKSNGTETFIAFNESIIVSYGDYTTSGTLITFENVSNDIATHVHYRYLYQANTNGRNAHIYTDFDGVEVDAYSFTDPYSGDSDVDRDNVSDFGKRTFVESNEHISDEIEFRFSNGDWRVRIADIRVRKHASPEPTWSYFSGETTPTSDFEVTVLDEYDEVPAGEEVIVDFEVVNLGAEERTQMIEFRVDGELEDSFELTLTPDEVYEGEFIWTTEDVGDYDLVVASEDSKGQLTVEVVEPAYFEVQVLDFDDEIVEGEMLIIEYVVTNTGGSPDTQTIDLLIEPDQTEVDSDEVTLETGQESYDELRWNTEDHQGDFELIVASEDQQDEVAVTILQDAELVLHDLLVNGEGTEVTVEEGEEIDITVILENMGDLEGDITVTVYEFIEADELEKRERWNYSIEGDEEKEIADRYEFENQGKYTVEVSEEGIYLDSVMIEVEEAADDDGVLDYWWVIFMIVVLTGWSISLALLWRKEKSSQPARPGPPRGQQRGKQ